jgi:superfamily I DNA/RNA helicase
MPKSISTKQFTKCLRDLTKKGKKGKDALMKARAAQAEWANEGAIQSLKLTNHGESRLPNAEKFDLGDGYRLVTQLVAPDGRAFLYVGDHEDADRWLDNHRDYKWVKNDSDQTLDFVQISDSRMAVAVVPDVDLESPESLLGLPLLRDVTEEEWSISNVPPNAVIYLKTVTAEAWEQDPTGVVEHVARLADADAATLAIDLLTHAHQREWDQMHRRIGLASGQAVVVDGKTAIDAMLSTANSEQFVTWDDLESIPESADWADWMLFLHPEQKEFAVRDFNGPARLRGVSGSGKTCVMVHRARRLARKYKQDILLVTLTESMRRLLDILVKMLCGVEAAYIKTSTMNSIATDAIESLAFDGLKSFSIASRDQVDAAAVCGIQAVKLHPAFGETVLSKIHENDFAQFVRDEITFVRMRFLPDNYEKYLRTQRHGRQVPLPEKARIVILAGVEAWDNFLIKYHLEDHEGIVQHALNSLQESSVAARNTFRYRCVLVDEVQDLSQLEMRILGMIPDSNGKRVADQENGMFLVGDGAQSIYSRGFTLKDCNISVANRSFVLQKNYRNTREILEAAYGLISSYEFADVDEDNIATPTPPHLSARHGERPYIVKAMTWEDESAFVVSKIREMLEDQRLRDEADELTAPTEIPISVIAFNQRDRVRIEAALRKAQIPTTQLRDDVGWDNNAVKISTLESAKGHEFHAVFIVGVCQGVIPHGGLDQSEWKREAARLYVAMTRARDHLFLTYTAADRRAPSVFLAAIREDCNEFEWRRGALSSVD